MTLPELRIPVFIEIDHDTMPKLGAMVNPADPSTLAALIEQGLRAQLQLESIVTGVLFVELDLFPDSPVTLFLPKDSGYVEIPTQPTLLQEASQTAADLVAKLRDIDFDGLVDVDARRRARRERAGRLARAAAGARVAMRASTLAMHAATRWPRSGRASRPLAGRVDSGVAQTPDRPSQQLDRTLGSVKTHARLGFDTLVDPRAPLVYQADHHARRPERGGALRAPARRLPRPQPERPPHRTARRSEGAEDARRPRAPRRAAPAARPRRRVSACIPTAEPEPTRFYTLALPVPEVGRSGEQSLALGLGPISCPATSISRSS